MSKPIERLQQQEFIIMNRIVRSDEICAALMFNEKDFLNSISKLPESREDIMYFNYIYPHDFIPSRVFDVGDNRTEVPSIEDMRSYITISFTDYRPAGGVHLKANSLVINIFTHQNLEEVSGMSMTRTRFIAYKINELFEEKYGLGIGKTNFSSMNTVRINEYYQGYSIVYRMDDFR